jgi:PAS domain S-box-containing protein
MTLSTNLSVIAGVVTTCVGLYVLLSNPKRETNRVFAMISANFALYSFSEFMTRSAVTVDQAFFWGRVEFTISILLGAMAVHFAEVFPRKYYRQANIFRSKWLMFLYGAGIVVAILFNIVVTEKNIAMSEWGYRMVLDFTTLFGLAWVGFCILIALNVFLFTYLRRKITLEEKKQLLILMVGFMAVIILALTTNSLPPLLHLNVFPMASLSLTLFSIVVAYGIVNVHLMLPSMVETAETVVNTMADALLVVNENETIVQVNKSAESLLGYNQNEMLGQQLSYFVQRQVKTDRVFELPMFQALASTGRIKDVEVMFLSKTGVTIPINVSASHVLNENNKVEGTVIVARDLTETKKLIDELAIAKNFLEVKVEERTRELYQANLELQNEVITRIGAEGHLRKSLEEKEFLLKEIHHRVKNNLQVISSILDLQAGSIADTPTLTVFKESQNRIRSMSLVHEQLYLSDDFARIDFERYLQRLASNIFHTLGYNAEDIRLDIKASNISLSIDDSISCGFIVTELITNSFKHGFPKGAKGTIAIQFEKTDDGMYQLIVRDNGVGFPANVDFRNTKTLGLQLVNILTQQLKGTITLHNNGGTMFTIRFPNRVKAPEEQHGKNQGFSS